MEKLVRDRIPYFISKNDGKAPTVRYPKDDAEALKFILAKLDEEVAELREALWFVYTTIELKGAIETATLEAYDEAADVMEVLLSLFPQDILFKVLQKKRNERGSFNSLAIIDFSE